MIDPDEDSINDYHNAYKLEKDTTTIKQKFMQKMYAPRINLNL